MARANVSHGLVVIRGVVDDLFGISLCAAAAVQVTVELAAGLGPERRALPRGLEGRDLVVFDAHGHRCRAPLALADGRPSGRAPRGGAVRCARARAPRRGEVVREGAVASAGPKRGVALRLLTSAAAGEQHKPSLAGRLAVAGDLRSHAVCGPREPSRLSAPDSFLDSHAGTFLKPQTH